MTRDLARSLAALDALHAVYADRDRARAVADRAFDAVWVARLAKAHDAFRAAGGVVNFTVPDSLPRAGTKAGVPE